MHIKAQSGNERVRTITVANDTLTIDTLSIIPGTMTISYVELGDTLFTILDSSFFKVEYFNSRLIFLKPFEGVIRIQYQVFPYLFTRTYFNKNPALFDSANINFKPYVIDIKNSEPYLNISGLDYNGSFARGISFGNNQDVVVNSDFNLQLNGKLQNDVNISASITDNNIPIQPEGNTQQLQEFDKVFIQLSKNRQQLIMGDYEIYRPPGYFMNYYKKLQGASYTGAFDLYGGTFTSGLSLAVAKGNYSRQDIPIIEGNQGPYKLKGNNGETFIIILAGTERVYIDGKLMVRGAENDYIIDYNAGEIAFTTKVLLTKDKRVQIEFEYSDKNYFRSLVYSGSTFTSGDDKLSLHLNIYSEQDSKNQPLDQTIDSEQRNILSSVGDLLNQAFSSGIDSIAFDASRIMYKMVDTLGFDFVFVFSTHPDSAKYALSFTELGSNNGNYILTTTSANGRVYQWVAPIAGVPQGSAEPVILLIAPKKSTMVALGGSYQLTPNHTIGSEIAFTNNDVNTFSEIDNADNSGFAYKGSYNFNKNISATTKIQTQANYEFAAANFAPPERYRSVEFNRDWNIFSTEKTNEHYANAGLTISGSEKWNLGFQSSAFIREDEYSGFLQALNGGFTTAKWNLTAGGSFLQSSDDSNQAVFFRPKASITRTFPAIKQWKTGILYEGEHNAIATQGDSLLSTAFYYDQLQYFIGSSDTAKTAIKGEIITRLDKLPLNGKFTNVTQGNTYSLNGAFNKKINNKYSWQLTYRTLSILDTSLTLLNPEKSLLGRLQNSFTVKKGLVTGDLFYELGTGQEPKRTFTYVEVEPGLGVYTWNDYNANGAQELDEFEIAVFADEANFVQVITPTDEYIQSNLTNFNYALGLNPKVIWHDSKGFEGFVGKFAAQSSLQLSRKVLDDQSLNAYNPFFEIADSLLVSSNVYWLNTLFFNRAGTKFGIDYSYLRNFNKIVITVGPESRGKDEHKIIFRYKIAKPITVNGTFIKGNKSLVSDAFTNKTYFIPYYSAEPKITFIQNSVFRTTAFYQYTTSKNNEGAETLISNEFTLDVRYNVVAKSTISAKFSYIEIAFEGIEDTPVGYAMLEGLNNGNNLLWNLTLDRKLSQLLQLTASYEGRKTGDNPITHLGRLQMRAIF
ncbi:MAG: hypothetical protein V9F05_01890 [Chitinophagaceae bacterium]